MESLVTQTPAAVAVLLGSVLLGSLVLYRFTRPTLPLATDVAPSRRDQFKALEWASVATAFAGAPVFLSATNWFGFGVGVALLLVGGLGSVFAHRHFDASHLPLAEDDWTLEKALEPDQVIVIVHAFDRRHHHAGYIAFRLDDVASKNVSFAFPASPTSTHVEFSPLGPDEFPPLEHRFHMLSWASFRGSSTGESLRERGIYQELTLMQLMNELYAAWHREPHEQQ